MIDTLLSRSARHDDFTFPRSSALKAASPIATVSRTTQTFSVFREGLPDTLGEHFSEVKYIARTS
jgi:hypothetical protein